MCQSFDLFQARPKKRARQRLATSTFQELDGFVSLFSPTSKHTWCLGSCDSFFVQNNETVVTNLMDCHSNCTVIVFIRYFQYKRRIGLVCCRFWVDNSRDSHPHSTKTVNCGPVARGGPAECCWVQKNGRGAWFGKAGLCEETGICFFFFGYSILRYQQNLLRYFLPSFDRCACR